MRTVARPYPIDTPAGQQIELYTHALTTNRFYRRLIAGLGALLLVSLVALVLLYQKALDRQVIFIRIDEAANHEVVDAAAITNPHTTPQDLRHDLKDFTIKYASRLRGGALSRDFADSLVFLAPQLQEELARAGQQDIQRFLRSPQLPEIDVRNLRVSLTQLQTAPYHAQITFEKISRQAVSRLAQPTPDRWTYHIDFLTAQRVPREALAINPHGILITNLRTEGPDQ